MTLVVPVAVEKITARMHRWMYRRSNGRRGGTVGAGSRPVALLTTTGRRTDQPREWPVIYLQDDENLVVVASNAGRDHHPAWYLNLQAHPDCIVQVGDRRMNVLARDAAESEAAALWPRLHAMYPGYKNYADRTERKLPVVILEPATGEPS